jgi:hypothetical protein
MRYLNEIPIRITNVNRYERADRTAARHGALLDGNALGLQMCDAFDDRRGCEEAEIGRAGRGRLRVRYDGGIGGMKIDLLLAEGQRPPAVAECNRVHAKQVGIEGNRSLDVADGQDNMVEAFDLHDLSRCPRFGKLFTGSASYK